jgi:hypothetical protein
LPSSRSHNGPTNPRNKPQTILKRKHNSRSKELSCPTKAQVDGPRGCGGRSESTGRMVRKHRADGLRPSSGQSKKTTEPPVPYREKWTVCALSPNGPRATGATRTVRGLQADSLACTRTVRYPYTDGPTNTPQRNFDTSKDLRARSQELDVHVKNSHHVDGSRATGGQSAGPRTGQHEVKIEKSTSPIPPWISQTT